MLPCEILCRVVYNTNITIYDRKTQLTFQSGHSFVNRCYFHISLYFLRWDGKIGFCGKHLLGRAGEQSLDVLDGLKRWLFIWTRWLCYWREMSLSRGSQPVFSQHFSCVCYSDWDTAGASLQPQSHLWPYSPNTRPSLDTEPPSLHFRSNPNLVTLYGKKKEKTRLSLVCLCAWVSVSATESLPRFGVCFCSFQIKQHVSEVCKGLKSNVGSLTHSLTQAHSRTHFSKYSWYQIRC